MNLPIDFLNRMKSYLSDEYDAFIESYEAPEIKGLRVNTVAPGFNLGAICNEKDINDKVPWCENGYSYDSSDETFRPGRHPYHEAGAYYIQEPSAMAPVEYLDVKPGDRVLDLCAAPGGKSTQIAGKLQGEGILISNEIMPDRARILSENIERMGVRNALVISEDPRNISVKFAGFFDKVLVDAPCSGEGMFRRSEIAVNEWSLENVALCADRQSWILDEAAKMLAPGGTLVYSTCTFSKEEDEEQVVSFLKRHPEFTLAPMSLYGGMRRGFASEESGNEGIGVRLWPHLVSGEGHFVCKLEKASTLDSEVKNPPPCGYDQGLGKKDLDALKEMREFLKENMVSSDELISQYKLTRFKDNIYMLPKECPSLKGLKVMRPGLHIGTILKNRFEPGHALAMALKESEYKKICRLTLGDSKEAYKFINGETFNVTPQMLGYEEDDYNKVKNGWYLITIDGISIGWGKLTNLIMKNHYPKGLRKSL